jgi:hypothetical protein
MPPWDFVQRIEVFVAFRMRVLHRHARAKLDMLANRLPERLVVWHADRIEGSHVQLDKTLPLGFGNLEMTMDGDDMVKAQFPAKVVGPSKGFGGKGGQMVNMLGLSCAEERLE